MELFLGGGRRGLGGIKHTNSYYIYINLKKKKKQQLKQF